MTTKNRLTTQRVATISIPSYWHWHLQTYQASPLQKKQNSHFVKKIKHGVECDVRVYTGKDAWKSIPPTNDAKLTKENNGKTFHWCKNHEAWVSHFPKDCRWNPEVLARQTVITLITSAADPVVNAATTSISTNKKEHQDKEKVQWISKMMSIIQDS